MVDGRTTEDDLQRYAKEFGLGTDVVNGLLLSGMIRRVSHEGAVPTNESTPMEAITPGGAAAMAQVSGAPMVKRSLAAARLYLMDIVVRIFGTPDHPIRDQLIAATDFDSVDLAFESLRDALQKTATPALVAHIEATYRNQLPGRT